MRALLRPLGPILVLAALMLAACDSAAKRAEDHYQRALELVAAGDTARADVEFRTVFKLNPEHEPARLAYARMLRDQGDVQEAMAQYQHLVDQDPDDLEGLKDLTDLALKVQDLPTARSSVDRAFTLAPDDLEVRAFKAALDYRGDDRAAAVLMAEGVIAAAPASIPARMVLVADRLAAKAPGEALAQADAGLALAPDDEGLHLARLAALEAEGDTVAMKAELLAMAARFPDNTGVRQALVQFYLRAGDTDAAEAVLRELADRTPDQPQGYLTVVQFLFQLRGPDAALAELDRLIAAHPDSLPFRRARAGLDFAQGRTDAAIAAMHALVDGAAPSDTIRDTQVALAGMLANVGDTAGRDALLTTVLQADPANVDALKLRARGEVAGDQPELAIQDMRTALGQAPNDPEVMTIMAYAHDRNGNRDLAAESFSRAVEASGQGVQESLNYARFLMQDDRPGPAEGVIVDALRRAPENPELLDTLGRIHLARHDWARVGQVADLLRKTGDPQAARMADALQAASLQGQNRTGDTIAMLKDLADSGGDGQAMADLMRAYIESGDVAGAQTYVDGVLAKDPASVPGRMMQAGLQVLRGETDAAETGYRAVIADAPALPQPYQALFALLSGLGRGSEAQAVLDQGLAATSQNGVENGALLFTRAGLREQEGDFEGAIADYETLYARDSSATTIANNLASLLSSQRSDPASLERAFAIARRLKSSDVPYFQDTYGWILALRGDAEQALGYLEPAARALPQNALVQFHLAEAQLARGDRGDARASFARVVALAGSPEAGGEILPQVAQARARLAEIDASPAAPADAAPVPPAPGSDG
jgi:tetratricopeptide (TPR) repeat protein